MTHFASESLLKRVNDALSDKKSDLDVYGMSTWTIIFASAGTVLAGAIALWFWAKMATDREMATRRGNQPDPKLPPPTEIVSLRVYPIKSCRGIEVKSCKLKKTGLELDRDWMFVDAEKKQFLTIRSDPSMTLIDTRIVVSERDSSVWATLEVSIHGTDDMISIPCNPTENWLKEHCELEEVEIWGEKTDGWKYPDKINKIFTKFFKKEVWLVYKGPSPRMAGGNADAELYGKEEPHHFADVMSLQVASQASLDDLNRRLEERGADGNLTIERFRPNIIIKGNEPWEEDRWKRVQINTIDHSKKQLWRTPLDVLARCARCQVPNVDPSTAEKHAHEPWDTLMKFRRVDPGSVAKYKPCFGMLCMPTKPGVVTVGSEIVALELTEKHLYNTAKFADL